MDIKFRFNTSNGYAEFRDKAEGEKHYPGVIPEIIEIKEELEQVMPSQRNARKKTQLGNLDFNDIQSRLNSLNAILETRFNYNLQESVDIESIDTDKTIKRKISFGKDADGADIWNKIKGIINNIAHFKDPLKKAIRIQGENPQLIEDEINSRTCLQIIIDISNSWKHGYPLDRGERSNKSPKITNPKKSLSLCASEAGTFSSFSLNPITGEMEAFGDVAVVINADIVDRNGNHLYSLSQLIDECTEAWLKIIEKYKIFGN